MSSDQLSTKPLAKTGHYGSIATEDVVEYKGAIYESMDAPFMAAERKQCIPIQATSGLTVGTNNTFSGGQLQWKISKSQIVGRLKCMQLEWTLKNTDAANSVTAAAAPYLVTQLIVSVNGQQASQNQIVTQDQLYLNLQYKPNEELQNMNGGLLNLLNMNISTMQANSGSAIGPGQTQTVILPIESMAITKFLMQTVDQDQYLIANLPSTAPTTAGTGTLVFTNVVLRIYNEINTEADPITVSTVRAGDRIINFPNSIISQATYSLTASTPAQIPLQALQGGMYNQLYVMIRQVGLTATALTTFVQLNGSGSDADAAAGSIEIKTGSGVSITGSPLTPTFMRSASCWMNGNQGVMTSLVPIYNIFFGHNDQFYKDGTLSKGQYVVNSADMLWLTPGALFASGSYSVTVLGASYGSMIQRNGQFSVI